MSASNSSFSPVQQAERIQIVDILRGFALFGILFVNMMIFSRPIQVILFPADPALPWFERAAEWLIHFAGESKFYALFSLLFGLGLTLLMERVEGRGGKFVPLYLRRLLVLLGFGLIHAFLIWMGDILILYALLGLLLILFRKAKTRTLLIWTVILVALPLLFNAAATVLVELGRSVPESAQQIEAAFAETIAAYQSDLARAYRVYANGNFAEITEQRIYDYTSMGFTAYFVMGFNVMAMFLLGVYFGKRGIFRDLQAHRGLFRKCLAWGLTLGLGGNAIYATLIPSMSRIEPSWPLLLATVAQGIGAPLLMLAYVSAFCLLALSPVWGKRIQVLAPVGQMALTNYLTQSIVCTLIFYSYGLGLFGKMGAAQGIGLTIAIYLLQIPFSHWWMKHFKYGPVEWLWRSITYGKPQPMRRLE
ncbi:MAG: DUF418 domain-containing protein [Anaerolineales bacterium]|nr:DUF418 domain-containing protein [Anaerolineales bacterium]